MFEAIAALYFIIQVGTIGDLHEANPIRETYQCFTKSLGQMVDAREQLVNGRRVNVQGFDRNGDGEVDLQLVFEYVGGGGLLRPFATTYVFDENGDGIYDYEFLDSKGDGRCPDMVRIPVGSAFTQKRL